MSTILAKMAVQIAANTAEFNKGLSQASGGLTKFKSDVMAVGTALLTAFSVKEIAQFVLETNKLAGTFEGVQRAFQRLPNSTLLMENLRQSTHGTVDQLMLMQQALRARNFGISVKDLGTYLEFAAIRAQQTGESIDYMVNSIILGLGRGSIKILDNLQVNIAKIKETVKETGVSLQEAFRQQVIEQMKVIGGYAETSATQVDRLTVAIKALKLEAAQKAESSGLIKFFTDATEAMRVWIKSNGNFARMQIVMNLERIEQDAIKRTQSFTNALTGNLDAQKEAVQQQMNTLVELINKRNAELRKVNEELASSGTGLDTLDKRKGLVGQSNAMKANIQTMQRQIELLKEYFKTLGQNLPDVNRELGIIEKLRAQIENEESFMEMALSEKEIAASRDKLKELNAELDRLLGKKAKGGLKLEFLPDLEAEGSTNPELRNQQAINDAKEFSKAMADIAHSVELTGGAFIRLEEPTNNFKKAAREIIDISGLVAGGIIDIANAFGEAASGSINFGDAILRSLANFAQQFGALLIATGIGKIAFNKFSGPAMIAAGATLVALGGAVRSAISNRPNLGSEGAGGSFGNAVSNPYSIFYEGVTRTPSIILEARGTSLVGVIGEQDRRNGRLRPNTRRLG